MTPSRRIIFGCDHGHSTALVSGSQVCALEDQGFPRGSDMLLRAPLAVSQCPGTWSTVTHILSDRPGYNWACNLCKD